MKIENDIRKINIQQLQPAKKQELKSSVKQYPAASSASFTGINPIAILNYFDTNPAWGACFVDVGFMVIPRTGTDFGRNMNAGLETLRREGMGTTNHSSVGLYGTAAGLALATGLNHTYGLKKGDVKAHSIFADAETIDMQSKIYDEVLKQKTKTVKLYPGPKKPQSKLNKYLVRTLQNYEAQTEDGSWVKFKKADITKAANLFEKAITDNKKSMSKDTSNMLRALLVSSTGVQNNIRIIAKKNEKPHTSRYTIDYIIENTYKLGKVFSKEKVKEAFMNSANATENAFIKSLKKMNKNRSLIGVGIASLIGMSTQPINMYITKKKTGSNAFVGGGEEDKSAKFKAKKAAVGAAFGAFVLSTIGDPRNLIKDLQFKGFTPTIKQFKFIYGITILSRFLVSRNDNELKEAVTKDFLGFVNWLILGNFVQKLVAQAMDKTLIKRNGKGIMNWITDSTLKTREEILHSALGKNVFKNGKALSFVEMLKALPENSPAKKQLKILTFAQLAGYAYSGLILGRGIPKLNIYMTNRRMAKQKAKENQNKQPADIMYTPENQAFLSKNNFTGSKLLPKAG